MHWRRKWQPTPVFLPAESQGWGSLVGFCLWGHTEHLLFVDFLMMASLSPGLVSTRSSFWAFRMGWVLLLCLFLWLHLLWCDDLFLYLLPHLAGNSCACMHAKSLQLCLTPCDTMDCKPPGSSVQGILQARILEWVAMSFSRGIFPTQGLNPHLLYLLHREGGSLPLASPGNPTKHYLRYWKIGNHLNVLQRDKD